uniref:Uncharacterized protein n=1 Tax=Setaria viridis TaxID=4556 RepID=A0A4U6SXA7_SETVI|nr:hypothetical protein SEVIR_9G232400v2 [Setaria viridis]
MLMPEWNLLLQTRNNTASSATMCLLYFSQFCSSVRRRHWGAGRGRLSPGWPAWGGVVRSHQRDTGATRARLLLGCGDGTNGRRSHGAGGGGDAAAGARRRGSCPLEPQRGPAQEHARRRRAGPPAPRRGPRRRAAARPWGHGVGDLREQEVGRGESRWVEGEDKVLQWAPLVSVIGAQMPFHVTPIPLPSMFR